MTHSPKLATCCYCGARTALVLGASRHELACGSCGAPITQLKSLPSDKVNAKPARPAVFPASDAKPKKSKKTKKKKRSPFHRLLHEVADELGDLFD